jgi:translation initiation factor 3 subunit J
MLTASSRRLTPTSQVLDTWEAADDSEVEREKVKKAAEAKAKADDEAKALKKSRAARIAQHKEDSVRRKQEVTDSDSDSEDDVTRRARLRKEQKEADLRHAEDLFGDLSIVGNNRNNAKPVTLPDANNPTESINLSALPIFNPSNKDGFTKLRDALVPLLGANAKKAHYVLFMQEFTKQICKDLPSDQIKKIASGLTTLSNEKMKEEKLAEKGGKKSKAAKSKVTLNASRDVAFKADLGAYDDGLDE